MGTHWLREKLLSRSITFVYNDLCAVSTAALDQTEADVVDTLLKPNVRLTTSTPVSDPMGDYTWQLFRNADKAQAFAVRDGGTGGDLHGSSNAAELLSATTTIGRSGTYRLTINSNWQARSVGLLGRWPRFW